MNSNYLEKRRFQRIFFSMQTCPRVKLITLGFPDDPFVAEVVNLSEGGLGLVAEHTIAPFLSGKDQQLQIQAIEGNLDLRFLVGEINEVRWVLNSPQIHHIGFGCRFISLSGAARLQIQETVCAAMQEHQKRSTG